jgi:hypothetical protein
MKLRKLKRIRARRWDSVHSSWSAVLDHDVMYPIRKVRPCRTYSAWCSDCNAALFPEVMGRFPHNVVEFNDFEQTQQENEGEGE